MKRTLVIQLAFLLAFLLLTALVKHWIDLPYLPYLIGGVIGTLLPNVDYFIYHYYLRTPKNPSVDTIVNDVTSKEIFTNVAEASEHAEEKPLILHSAHFLLIFLLFALLIVTSSSSLLGRGIVLGFLAHLLVDMYIDFREKKTIHHWFRKIPYELDARQEKWVMIISFVLLLVFGFLM